MPSVLHALGWFGLFEECQQPAGFTQRRDAIGPHALGHALWGAEQVRQYRDAVTFGALEQQRGPAGAKHPVANFSHLQARIDGGLDALKLAGLFQLGDEITQILVVHERFLTIF